MNQATTKVRPPPRTDFTPTDVPPAPTDAPPNSCPAPINVPPPPWHDTRPSWVYLEFLLSQKFNFHGTLSFSCSCVVYRSFKHHSGEAPYLFWQKPSEVHEYVHLGKHYIQQRFPGQFAKCKFLTPTCVRLTKTSSKRMFMQMWIFQFHRSKQVSTRSVDACRKAQKAADFAKRFLKSEWHRVRECATIRLSTSNTAFPQFVQTERA